MPEQFQANVLEQLSELRDDVRSLRTHVDTQIADLRSEHRSDHGETKTALRDLDRKFTGGSDAERGVLARIQQIETDGEQLKSNQAAAIKADKANRKRRTNLLWAGIGAAVMAGGAIVGERVVRAVMPEVQR